MSATGVARAPERDGPRSPETRLDQHAEGTATMAYRVLLLIRHLRGRAAEADRLEAGIVAVTAESAWRPDDVAIERAVHQLEMLVRPGQRQHAVEGRRARRF